MGIPVFVSHDESTPTACLAPEKTSILSRSPVSRHRHRSLSRSGSTAASAMGEMRRRRRIEASIQSPEDLPDTARYNTNEMRTSDIRATLNSRAIVRFERERERMRQRSSTLNHERRRGLGSEIQVSLMPAAADESGDMNEINEVSQQLARLRQTRINHIRRTAQRNSASPPALDTADHQNQLISSWLGASPVPSRSNSHDHQFISASTYRTQNSNLQSDHSYLSRTHLHSHELRERTRALTQTSVDLDRSRRSTFQAQAAGLGDTDRVIGPEISSWESLLTRITPDPQLSSEVPTTITPENQSIFGAVPSNITTADTSMLEEYELRVECASEPETDTESKVEEVQVFEMRRGEPLITTTGLYNGRNHESQLLENADSDDLGGWYRIISRLTERDDIPDEWWASVGLSRTLRPRSET